MKTPTNNVIALLCLLAAVSLTVYLFAESRNDPSLRIAALVSATGLVASLAAIGSTILVGKDVTKHDDNHDAQPPAPPAAPGDSQHV